MNIQISSCTQAIYVLVYIFSECEEKKNFNTSRIVLPHLSKRSACVTLNIELESNQKGKQNLYFL